MLRSLAERLSRGVIFRRTFPAEFGGGSLFVSPEGGLRYWRLNLRNVDPILLRTTAEIVREGATVWDVGANLGLFSFAAAGLAGSRGKVIAIEADTWLVEILRRSANLKRAAASPVQVLSLAVSESVALARFHISNRARSASYLEGTGTSQAGVTRESQLVMTVSLDWLLEHLPAPDVVKIDVEGAEAKVLRGAGALLSKIRPTILCEVNEENQAEVSTILHAFDYTIFDAELARDRRKALPAAPWATLAYSRERLPAELVHGPVPGPEHCNAVGRTT